MGAAAHPACPLAAAAAAYGERPAVSSPAGDQSFAALDVAAGALAQQLVEHGAADGCLAIAPEAGRPPIALLPAAWRCGAVTYLLSARLPAAARDALARDSGCWLRADGGGVVVRLPRSAPLPAGFAARLAPGTIVFTSGSTGAPKGVYHPVAAHLANARGVVDHVGLRPGDRWLLSLPLYHVAGIGILMRCLQAGATVVVPPDAEELSWAQLRALRISHLSLVPTQLQRLLRQPGSAPSLRCVMLGGAGFSEELLAQAHAAGLPVLPSYGCSEMASTVTAACPGAPPAGATAAGAALAEREVRIDAAGEICVRGAPLFAGYIGETGLDLPLDEDGWFHTGDLGRLDAGGILHVRGRRDNMFISGGENIQPETIERALIGAADVVNACVVPVPDAEFGHRPAAFVQMADGVALDAAGLAAHITRTLPRFMVPDLILPWPHELAPDAKPDRPALAARAAASETSG
jgi:O-succinylbenzoic acid--CoA ligase